MLSVVTVLGLLGLLALGIRGLLTRFLPTPAPSRAASRGTGAGRRQWDPFVVPSGPGVNTAVVAVEILAVAVGIVTAGVVVLHPVLPAHRKALIVATILVAITLIGDAISVRLGFRSQFRRGIDYRALAETTTDGVAATYAAMWHSLGNDRLDEATVGVLAVAVEGEPLQGIVRWGERTGIRDPEAFRASVDELVAAGVVEERNGRLRTCDPFAGTDPARIADAVESILR